LGFDLKYYLGPLASRHPQCYHYHCSESPKGLISLLPLLAYFLVALYKGDVVISRVLPVGTASPFSVLPLDSLVFQSVVFPLPLPTVLATLLANSPSATLLE
jgi:hypothetical protein